MQPMDDEAAAAAAQAEDMEVAIELTQQDEADTVSLLHKLDKLAASYFEHAKSWDGVNPAIAAKVRKQGEEVHELHHKVERMAEWEADEIQTMMADVERVLRKVRRNGDSPE